MPNYANSARELQKVTVLRPREMSKRKITFAAITPDAQNKRRVALSKGQQVQPVILSTQFGFELQLHNMRFEDGMRVARANVPANGHWMVGTPAQLKGNQERDNYPHWLAYFSHGLVRMPVACKQIALSAIEICDTIIWPELQFAPCDDRVKNWPERSLIFMQLEHEQSDAVGYALYPDSAQYARSSCLDWEWLFLKEFPEFKRTTVHIEAASSVYKGSAFTCMEDKLGNDLEAKLNTINTFWARYGFICVQDRGVSK